MLLGIRWPAFIPHRGRFGRPRRNFGLGTAHAWAMLLLSSLVQAHFPKDSHGAALDGCHLMTRRCPARVKHRKGTLNFNNSPE